MVTDGNKYWFEQDETDTDEIRKDEVEKGAIFQSGTDEKKNAESYAYTTPFPQKEIRNEQPNGTNAYDPHERHYRSDFAKRASAPEMQLNKSGKPKLVRGAMLKKLLKYDYRALFKYLIPCYIAVGATAVISFILYVILNGTASQQTAFRIVLSFMTLFQISVQATLIVGTIAVIIRFYRNLYSGEGYLTLSIPATAEEHLFSKLISSVSVLILGTVITTLGELLAYFPVGGAEYFLSESSVGVIWAFCRESSVPVLVLFEILILALTLEIFSVQLFYTCISLGQMVTSKNRVAAAVGFYFLFTVVGSILFSVFFVGFLFDLVDGGGIVSLFESIGGHGLIWIGIAVLIALNVAEFFIERQVLKNKVNLA